MSTQRGEYKGSPTISLHTSSDCSDKFPFSFGKAKAELVLLNLQDIIDFVREVGDPTISDHVEDMMMKPEK